MRMRLHGETAYRPPTVQPLSRSDGAALDLGGHRFEARPPTVEYMFADLQKDPANRLPESQRTLPALDALGRAMANEPSNNEGPIPAAYTYFGQFVDHDITKTTFDASLRPPGGQDLIDQPALIPIAPDDLPNLVFNERTMRLDLDSVYLGAAIGTIDGTGRFQLGLLSPSGLRPIPTVERTHDLPRLPPNPADDVTDRAALIGDPRNDENLLVAQTHVAFLRSHNRLIDRGMTFDEAKRAIRRRYQWAVLHDFLPRVCDPAVVEDVLTNGARFFAAERGAVMPVEFSAAAYRFGHSMIREAYDHNATFGPVPPQIPATFQLLFTFTALSGSISPVRGPSQQFPTLPDNWTIDWRRFFATEAKPASDNPARLIDTHLMPELRRLPDGFGAPTPGIMGVLAARNLRRGYLLGLPTGQAVAAAIGVPPLDRQILLDAVGEAERDVVEAAGLIERTPLWFYILAEAGSPAGNSGHHLGPVGSRIVAETLLNCARFAEDSVIGEPPTAEELATGEFAFQGIVRIGIDAHFNPF